MKRTPGIVGKHLTPFGEWLYWRFPRFEVDLFPRYVWKAPGVLSHRRLFPKVRVRLWSGPPHWTADRTVLKIWFEVNF